MGGILASGGTGVKLLVLHEPIGPAYRVEGHSGPGFERFEHLARVFGRARDPRPVPAHPAVGANPHAARTAGMNVGRTTIITMAISGALAGLAGVQAALGPTVYGVPVPLTEGLVGTVDPQHDVVTVTVRVTCVAWLPA